MPHKIRTDFYRIVKEKEGKVVDPYKRCDRRVMVVCKWGHPFTTTPANVQQGNWCRLCTFYNEEKSQEFIRLVQEKGGFVCSQYRGNFGRIRLYCSQNHEFFTTPFQVGRGFWCGICRAEKDHEEFLEFLKKRDGELVGPFNRSCDPVIMKCSQGHFFSEIPRRIRDGIWCPECLNSKRIS